MLRAIAVVRKAAVAADRVVDTVTLDHEGRNRRRIALQSDAGLEFLLDLDRVTTLADGDAVELEDGRLVEVRAAPQRLLAIRAEDPLRLVRVAYHVGNRHAPAEVAEDTLYVEDDHVLAAMVRAQGCTATPVLRAFQPERGAYEHGGAHEHEVGRSTHHHHGEGHGGSNRSDSAQGTGAHRHGHGR